MRDELQEKVEEVEREAHATRERLAFRRFMTPGAIQFVFWVGVLALFILGLLADS